MKNEVKGNILRCQLYHQSTKISDGWKRERVDNVCALLRLTRHELGALFAIKPEEMDRWHRKGLFPAYVALHFALLESWYLAERTQTQRQPLIPLHILK